ncbi:hypothetical protein YASMINEVIRUS_1098 [Yasminevirus sp. GU-2018]|uniref:Uncharacterized protein n=1 Tax=Yasminevirus sp. GU-2018 TaxID=2420051 RepID=A0A5K0UAJ2_9VIRU|nr:hypothetical protein YASMINEVIRUS_1098 [Yasminevirus sp. GU-2018]
MQVTLNDSVSFLFWVAFCYKKSRLLLKGDLNMKVLIIGQIVLWRRDFVLDESIKLLFDTINVVIITVDNALTNPYPGKSVMIDQRIDHSISSDTLNFLPLSKCIFILANNHSTDYGVEGLRNWEHFCRKNSVKYVGLSKGQLYVDVGPFRLFAISSDKHMSNQKYLWAREEICHLTEDNLVKINNNLDNNKTNILFWHDHLNIDSSFVKRLSGVDLVFKTGDPYPLLRISDCVVSGLGSFIFESKKLDHYNSSIDISHALLIDTEDVTKSELITFRKVDKVIKIVN